MEDIYSERKSTNKNQPKTFIESLEPYEELQFTLENGADIQDGIVYFRNTDSLIDLMIKIRFFMKLRSSGLRTNDPITIFLDPSYNNEDNVKSVIEYLNNVIKDQPCNMVSRGVLTFPASTILSKFKGGRLISATSVISITGVGPRSAQEALQEQLIDQII